jgi:flagellin FlaB
MKEKLTNDRGQVGIGTLIVFIALVLVAAIAAGVLINTAGFLQTQAEQTGQDSTDQVADNINVIGEVGNIDTTGSNDPNEIDIVRLTVQRSPGSSEIDLTGLSIQWVGDNGFAQLVHGTDETGGSAAGYLIQPITAESDQDAVITADGDRYEIVVPLDKTDSDLADDVVVNNGGTAAYDNSDLAELGSGQRAELEITTDSGATRNVVIATPDSLVGLENDDTVTL